MVTVVPLVSDLDVPYSASWNHAECMQSPCLWCVLGTCMHLRKAPCCEAPSTLETINANWAYLMTRIRDARTHRKIRRAKIFQPGVQVRQVTLVPETTFQHCLAFSITSWKKLQLAFKQNTANGSWNTKHGCSIELKFKHGMFPCPLHQLKTLELETVYTCFFNNQDLHVPHPGLNELQLRIYITFIMHALTVDGNKCRHKWYKNKNGRKIMSVSLHHRACSLWSSHEGGCIPVN